MKQNKKIALTIFLISILQMSALGVSGAISDISAAFPDTSDSTVQMILTLPALFMFVFSIVSGKLSATIQKKYLITVAAVLIMISGTGGLLWHSNIYILLFWAAVVGSGIGFFMPINTSLIAIYFTGKYREQMSGQQVAIATVGGVCLSTLGGFIVKTGWSHIYIIFFAIIPGLICAWRFLPKENMKQQVQSEEKSIVVDEQKKNIKISPAAWVYIAVMFMTIAMYNIIPSNLTMYIFEKNMGGASIAGIVTAVFLLGGAVAGVIYPVIIRFVKDKIFLIAFACIIGGSAILFVTSSLTIVFISVFIAGSSVGFVMSQTVVRISEVESKESVTFAVSLLMAANCLGQCIAPVFTKLSALIFHTDSTLYRYLIVVIFGVVLMIITAILLYQMKCKFQSKAMVY
jgi:MFS family permease